MEKEIDLDKRINILGVNMDCLTRQEVLEKIDGFLNSEQQHQIATVNPEFILLAQKDQGFRNILNQASLSVPDGVGIQMAAKFLKIRSKNRLISFFQGLKVGWLRVGIQDVVPEIITGTDLVEEILEIRKLEIRERVFLLGGYGETPKIVADKLKEKYSYCEFDYSIFEAEDLLKKINNFGANILLAAVGHPRAQKWIDQNLKKMPSVRVAMGVGGAFDYISGRIKRAPRWMRKIGLEWLFRLIMEPRKRIKRIWRAVVVFPWRVYLDISNW